MFRRSFLAATASIAAAFVSVPGYRRLAIARVAAGRDPAWLIGSAGGCASHRAGRSNVRERMAKGFCSADFR